MPAESHPSQFERVVAREKAAIETHERAAVAEDATAAVIEDHARTEPDPSRATHPHVHCFRSFFPLFSAHAVR